MQTEDNAVLIRNSGGQKRVEWLIQNAEGKNFQPQVLYLAKLSFRNEGEVKTFPGKQRPTLQEILKEVLQVASSIPDGNLNPQEEMKSSKNGKYGDKYKKCYTYSLFLFKGHMAV